MRVRREVICSVFLIGMMLSGLPLFAQQGPAQRSQEPDQQEQQPMEQQEQQQNQPQDQAAGADQELQQRFITAERLMDQTVYDQAGEEVGEVETVYIRRDTGQVAFLSVGVGGFLGFGEQYYLIPWQQLASQNGGLVLNMTRDQFMQSPALTEGEFDATGGLDQDWITDSYEFYDMEPELGIESDVGLGTEPGL